MIFVGKDFFAAIARTLNNKRRSMKSNHLLPIKRLKVEINRHHQLSDSRDFPCFIASCTQFALSNASVFALLKMLGAFSRYVIVEIAVFRNRTQLHRHALLVFR